jgi:predicted glycosyltransferase involved in capsule biosynthesis
LDLTLNSLTGRVIVGEQLGERFSYTRHTNTYVRFPYTEFHRTKMLNEMSKIAETNIIVICDADVIVPIEQIYEAVRLIRQDGYDCIYPHDQFVKLSKEESITYETKGVLPDKAGDRSHGGMIFFNKESFFKGGMENEKFICWGLEDLERVNRFIKLGFRLKRIEGKLYHLWHPRGFNSSDINPHYKDNVKEYHKVKAMNKEQLTKYIKTWKR